MANTQTRFLLGTQINAIEELSKNKKKQEKNDIQRRFNRFINRFMLK